jgi:hypothetical protein
MTAESAIPIPILTLRSFGRLRNKYDVEKRRT